MKYIENLITFFITILFIPPVFGQISFTSHTISGKEFQADGAMCVFAIDIDRDYDIDVLSSSGLDNKIAWY